MLSYRAQWINVKDGSIYVPAAIRARRGALHTRVAAKLAVPIRSGMSVGWMPRCFLRIAIFRGRTSWTRPSAFTGEALLGMGMGQ